MDAFNIKITKTEDISSFCFQMPLLIVMCSHRAKHQMETVRSRVYYRVPWEELEPKRTLWRWLCLCFRGQESDYDAVEWIDVISHQHEAEDEVGHVNWYDDVALLKIWRFWILTEPPRPEDETAFNGFHDTFVCYTVSCHRCKMMIRRLLIVNDQGVASFSTDKMLTILWSVNFPIKQEISLSVNNPGDIHHCLSFKQCLEAEFGISSNSP